MFTFQKCKCTKFWQHVLPLPVSNLLKTQSILSLLRQNKFVIKTITVHLPLWHKLKVHASVFLLLEALWPFPPLLASTSLQCLKFKVDYTEVIISLMATVLIFFILGNTSGFIIHSRLIILHNVVPMSDSFPLFPRRL